MLVFWFHLSSAVVSLVVGVFCFFLFLTLVSGRLGGRRKVDCVMIIPTIHPGGISDRISFVLGGAVVSSLRIGLLLVLVFFCPSLSASVVSWFVWLVLFFFF